MTGTAGPVGWVSLWGLRENKLDTRCFERVVVIGELGRYECSSNEFSVDNESDIQKVFQSVWPEMRALTNPSRRPLDVVLGGSLPRADNIRSKSRR